ncbi:low choriolytic enzyme-like [Salminus brasiliensis]|uniref:low choriolytic enzyme-like n=1 Tax=Salminus brasiliensis TaxID=930266 RepID=UPI003B83231D
MHLTLTLILLLLLDFSPAQSRSVRASINQSSEETDNSIDKDDLSVSSIIERANKNAGQALDEPKVMFGDIAVNVGFQNADPCTARGCKWIKERDGNVYVPFFISNQYSTREKNVIESAMRSFERSTCVRFIPRTRQQDFVHIQSLSGCYSFVGRRGGGQVVSLNRNGCVYLGVVQHELLHALGFNHEQTRSDRDQHVRILLQNVIRGMEHNFSKIATINLNTPYDYNSVMHYGRYAFSRNREPTIIPIPNSNVNIGRATEMSQVDILRINRLYCG